MIYDVNILNIQNNVIKVWCSMTWTNIVFLHGSTLVSCFCIACIRHLDET